MTSKPVVEIIPSVYKHVEELRDDLRPGEQKEIMAFGASPQEGLTYSYRFSNFRRTALVDGKVAAMWGVQGALVGRVGHPYFLTGHEVLKVHPIKFTKIYLNQLEDMKKLYPVLENYVDADYAGAIRLLKIAGFSLEPFRFRDHDFYRFTMVTN